MFKYGPMTLTHVRGATFSYAGTAKLPAGTWSAAMRLSRGGGILIEEIPAQVSVFPSPDVNGHTHGLLFALPASESLGWPNETMTGRIWFTDLSGASLPSAAFEVILEAA